MRLWLMSCYLIILLGSALNRQSILGRSPQKWISILGKVLTDVVGFVGAGFHALHVSCRHYTDVTWSCCLVGAAHPCAS